MISPICERVLNDIHKYGKAILKYISANDVDITGGHQCGFYLPKKVWQVFTPFPPIKGENNDHPVRVLWPDGRSTNSIIKWYGKGTRSEYRLTGFGRDFQWRTFDNLGDLLVIVPININEFIAYELDLEEDIEELQADLGVEVLESWCYYEKGAVQPETEDECLSRHFRDFANRVEKFPEVRIFSETTRSAILDCIPNFGNMVIDDQLLRLIREEYNLYKIVERKLFQPETRRLFSSIDDFLQTASSILQRRKSRAGRSLENHVEYLFSQAGIPFQMRKKADDTLPDILIPGKAQYDDLTYPVNRLFMIGVKTTCKDRWRQVTQEAPRIKQKYILTLQEGITSKQLDEMSRSRVALIVPESLHKQYPQNNKIKLFTLHKFIDHVRSIYRT